MKRAVMFRATAHAQDFLPMSKRDILEFEGCAEAWRSALAAARLSLDDLSFVETHDCFTIAEIIACEDLGFAKRGEGAEYARAGHTARDGSRPINTSGGLKSKGHPVGATGVGQICDIALQVRGEAGELQLARHDLGLAQNLGGSGASAVVTVLGK